MSKNRRNWFRITLLLLFFAGSYFAVMQANYPMIYFLKAQIAGITSVLLLIIGFYIYLKAKNTSDFDIPKVSTTKRRFFKNDLKTAQVTIWTAIAIYTLNVFFTIIIAFLGFYIFPYLNPYQNKDITSNISDKKATGESLLLSESSYLLLLVLVMLWIDVIRELSVWHTYSIRLFPLLSLVIAIILVITNRFYSIKR